MTTNYNKYISLIIETTELICCKREKTNEKDYEIIRTAGTSDVHYSMAE